MNDLEMAQKLREAIGVYELLWGLTSNIADASHYKTMITTLESDRLGLIQKSLDESEK